MQICNDFLGDHYQFGAVWNLSAEFYRIKHNVDGWFLKNQNFERFTWSRVFGNPWGNEMVLAILE